MSSKPTIRIGKRFCERLGHELQQCATYCARNKWDDAERTYQEVEQMLDTFRTETGITAYLENKDENNEDVAELPSPEVAVPAASVAAESEPTEEGEGPAKQIVAGAGKSKTPRKRSPSTNKGKKRPASSK